MLNLNSALDVILPNRPHYFPILAALLHGRFSTLLRSPDGFRSAFQGDAVKSWLPVAIVSAALVVCGVGLHLWAGQAGDETANPPTQKTLETLVNAFNNGQAAAVAACFAPEAEMIDEEGQGVMGRAAIEKVFADFLSKNPGAKMHLQPEPPRRVAPSLIMEDGTSTVTLADGSTQTARRYAAAFVKVGDQWLIASLREYPTAEEDVAAVTLKELEWLVGEWVDEGPEALVVISARWADDRRAIIRDFSIRVSGKEIGPGMQRIAIDPLTGQIRGWAFDGAGGHGESVWVKHGDEWLVKTQGVTSEGEPSSATHILKLLSPDRVLWRTVHRVVGNRVEPDLETTLVRRPNVSSPGK